MLDLTGINRKKPALKLRHRTLVRVGDSPHSSYCPACRDGVLAMVRNFDTHELRIVDACLLCGQRVTYTDIEPGHVTITYRP